MNPDHALRVGIVLGELVKAGLVARPTADPVDGLYTNVIEVDTDLLGTVRIEVQ